MRSTIIFMLLTTLCAGCIGIFDYDHEEQITGRYYLTAVDSREDMRLSYNPESDGMVGVVDRTIYAVGHDSDYIVLKQHPGEYDPNKSITNYYIVGIAKKLTNFPEKEVIGPLTIEQFNTKMLELGRNIPFTTVLTDLE